jgi:hypothetical protein
MGQKWLNRSGNRFWTSGGSLGLKREYYREYSLGSALLGRSARLAIKRLGAAQYMARVWLNCLLSRGASDARGIQWQTFKRHVWDTSCSDYAEFCTSEFVRMNELYTME